MHSVWGGKWQCVAMMSNKVSCVWLLYCIVLVTRKVSVVQIMIWPCRIRSEKIPSPSLCLVWCASATTVLWVLERNPFAGFWMTSILFHMDCLPLLEFFWFIIQELKCRGNKILLVFNSWFCTYLVFSFLDFTSVFTIYRSVWNLGNHARNSPSSLSPPQTTPKVRNKVHLLATYVFHLPYFFFSKKGNIIYIRLQ